MVLFFTTREKSVVAIETSRDLSGEEISKLSWLLGEARVSEVPVLKGWYAGPRKEMLTPWSTNAVEITQNMGIEGIVRMEELVPVAGPESPLTICCRPCTTIPARRFLRFTTNLNQ